MKQEKIEQKYLTISGLRIQQLLKAGQNGQYIQPLPGYAAKAIKKLGPGVNDVNGNMSFVFAKELGYPHNSIDRTSNPQADAVYATMLELLGEAPQE